MDGDRFDALILAFVSPLPRRRLLAAVVGSLSALGGSLFGLEMAEARKRRRRHRRKKQNGNSVPPPAAEPDCIPNCVGKTCGDNGCGGSCGPCGDGFVCEGGSCVCPQEREVCNGACLERCGGFAARNPGTCGCCGIGSIPCSLDSACCSNVCAGGVFCVELNTGAACTFDAQCRSNDCAGGQCAA